MVREIISSSIPYALFVALLEATVIEESSGGVLSKTTALPEVIPVFVTVVPVLPAKSVNVIEKLTSPSESSASIVLVADHVTLSPFALASTEDSPTIKTTGVWICSSEVNATVTTSSAFALLLVKELLELLDTTSN